MQTFKFHIQKAVSWVPRFRLKERTLTIQAPDLIAARRQVENEFPDWQVSMFWQDYDTKTS